MLPTIETFSRVDTALRTLFPSQVLPQIVNLDILRLSQIISYCTPRLSSGPAGFSLSPPRKSVKDAWLKTKNGSTTITCHQHQGWHVSWVSMYPRTKMTPQHMFMVHDFLLMRVQPHNQTDLSARISISIAHSPGRKKL